MSNHLDTSTLSTTAVTTDSNVPVNFDNKPIIWDKNDAAIAGALHQFGLWSKRQDRFETLFEFHAYSNRGKIYMDTVQSYSFITGTVSGTHDFDDPCPPTPVRVAKIVAAATAAKTAPPTFAASMGPGDSNLYIVNPMEVRKHRADLLVSLNHVFGKADWARSETEKAAGNGLKYLDTLRQRAAAASIKDRTAISAKFDSVKRSGVLGSLSLDSIDSFLLDYEQALTCLPPAQRPTDEVEAQMISTIAMRDPETRNLYEFKAESTPPSSLEEATNILKGILRGRVRNDEIDQYITGAPGTALAAAHPTGAAPCAPCEDPITVLTAAVAKLAATVDKIKSPGRKDPRKTPDKDKDKTVVTAPRNADGSVKEWISGMAKCKYCDGGHLHRDCTSDKAKEESGK